MPEDISLLEGPYTVAKLLLVGCSEFNGDPVGSFRFCRELGVLYSSKEGRMNTMGMFLSFFLSFR